MSLLNRRRLLLNATKSILPSAYRQVEYIESTGTQYIDTGFIPTINSRYELDVQFIEPSSKTEFCNGVTGYEINEGNYFRFGIGCLTENYAASYPNNWYFAVADKNNYPLGKDTHRHLFYIDMQNGSYGFDDTVYYQSITQFTQRFSLYLFARNHVTYSIIDCYCHQKLYGCKLYEGGEKVRDFIPCYRKLDGVAGMYDLVEGKFYTNKGTGEFLVSKNLV